MAEEEVPALASVPAVVAQAECPAAGARVQEGLAPAEVQGQRVNRAAFGKVAVVPVPEEVWEPVAPRVEVQAVGRAADPADRVVDRAEVAAGVALAQGPAAAPALEAELALAAAERGLAEEALVPAAELVVAVGAGKHLESG